jgi:hypothetical protein
MWDRLRYVWLPRACFVAALTLALVLVAAVVFAPWLPARSPRLLALFGEDAAVRRTALASAAGLVATAFVFFRPAGPTPQKPSHRDKPPGNMAGA